MVDSIAQYLDFANHHASSTPGDIRELCARVIHYNFHAAFVNPIYVSLAKTILNGQAKVGTVIAFPLGQDLLEIKVAAAKRAINLGADELDIVPDSGKFIAHDQTDFTDEMKTIVTACRESVKPIVVKFIIEPGAFDSLVNQEEQLKAAAFCVRESGADFIKLGSGLGPRGPSLADLKIVKAAVADTIKIKVAGGITNYETARAFLDAGANRIGTSHAVEIASSQPT